MLVQISNRNIRKKCEICSKLSIKIPERRQWHRSGVFIDNFEHISHVFLAFLLLNMNMSMLTGYLFLCNYVWPVSFLVLFQLHELQPMISQYAKYISIKTSFVLLKVTIRNQIKKIQSESQKNIINFVSGIFQSIWKNHKDFLEFH